MNYETDRSLAEVYLLSTAFTVTSLHSSACRTADRPVLNQAVRYHITVVIVASQDVVALTVIGH